MDKGKKAGKTSKTSGHGKKRRFTKKYKWYTCGKAKEPGSNRFGLFWIPLETKREKARVTKEVEETAADAPEVEVKELETKLHVTGVDLHIEENTQAHNTDDYECTKDRISFKDIKRDCPDSEKTKETAELVIRRGQDFKITITFDRKYDIKKNDIKLIFNLGDESEPQKGLGACITVDETGKNTKYKPKNWGATVVGQKDNSLTLNVFCPATAPIGEWQLSIRTIVDVTNGKDIIWEYKHTADFITILFNPWCKEDLVYLEDVKWRKEVVESDSGSVFLGSYRRISAKPWCFGQFKDGILDAAMRLVKRGFGGKPTRKMASPAAVSRIITQMVNAPDDGGVLEGNWSGDYSGGTSPTAWVGSVKILRQYLLTGEPVKYGQCWVFSGVTTTVCRALGIPCRSVTNHSSAHNTDRDRISIDIIKRKGYDGEYHEFKDDSIWNFHVWNECWFRTPDLNTDKVDYNGWQIIDATPQEYSDGVFCCGPAPLKAIKEGDIKIGQDTAFVYAEVNADKVWWKEDESSGRLFETKRDRKCVGRAISTHQPTGNPYVTWFGDLEREELKDAYKYEEGSDKEKQVNKKAEKTYRQMNCITDVGESDHECEEQEPVDIVIEEMKEKVMVGNGFGFNVFVKNRGKEDRTMKLVLKVLYMTYFDSCTGIAAVKKFEDVKLKKDDSMGKETQSPGQKYTIEIDEKSANKRPQDDFNFEVKAMAVFKENEHIVSDVMDYRLLRPDIQLKGPAKCTLFDKIEVQASFKNPLKVPLTQCKVQLEGSFDCVGDTDEEFSINDIGAGETWQKILHLRPSITRKTKRLLCVGFESNELKDITGSFCIEISNT